MCIVITLLLGQLIWCKVLETELHVWLHFIVEVIREKGTCCPVASFALPVKCISHSIAFEEKMMQECLKATLARFAGQRSSLMEKLDLWQGICVCRFGVCVSLLSIWI